MATRNHPAEGTAMISSVVFRIHLSAGQMGFIILFAMMTRHCEGVVVIVTTMDLVIVCWNICIIPIGMILISQLLTRLLKSSE